ncbi:uncharacterized protein IWZ02DRAFT_253411 [Phyllosticta citriasiana]|uniref:uncharacterized protein n=1 Tax=Phyllosticta citriasiana TaxID=595635 RepID=UPI0030FDA67F
MVWCCAQAQAGWWRKWLSLPLAGVPTSFAILILFNVNQSSWPTHRQCPSTVTHYMSFSSMAVSHLRSTAQPKRCERELQVLLVCGAPNPVYAPSDRDDTCCRRHTTMS